MVHARVLALAVHSLVLKQQMALFLGNSSPLLHYLENHPLRDAPGPELDIGQIRLSFPFYGINKF
jgi:hypothetical protein